MQGSLQKVYSTALFELSREEKTLEKVHDELVWADEVFLKNEELIRFLSAPTVETKEKKRIFSNIFAGELSETVMNFLCVLIDKKRIKYIHSVIEGFVKLYNEEMNILEVTAVTAVEMSDDLAAKLKAKLESVSGKRIVLSRRIDKSIIGGIVLEYNNTQIQASVRSRLEKIRAGIDSVIA